jgi:hypothetical protein
MTEPDGGLAPLRPPPTLRRRRGNELTSGLQVDPIKRLALIGPDELENVVQFWLREKVEKEYARVRQWGGTGDKGRDVVGYPKSDTDMPWDNFQCKRYGSKLGPKELWPELAKLVYWTYEGSYPTPRRYIFVAPLGVSSKFQELIDDPAALRKGMKKNWEKVGAKLCDFDEIEDYLAGFEFPELSAVEGGEIVEGLKGSAVYPIYFGGGLSKPRPPVKTPPPSIDSHELGYVNALVDAYNDDCAESIASADVAFGHERYGPHLETSRANFYCAESLREFSKDVLTPPNSFEELQDQVHDGIQPKLAESHSSGYARVLAVSAHATLIGISDHPLRSDLEPADRIGICHQLANDGRVKWR